MSARSILNNFQIFLISSCHVTTLPAVHTFLNSLFLHFQPTVLYFGIFSTFQPHQNKYLLDNKVSNRVNFLFGNNDCGTSILNKACKKIFFDSNFNQPYIILYNFILASYFHIYHKTLYIQCSFKYDDLNGFEIISKFVDAFFHRIMYVCGRNIKLIF